MTTIKVTPEQLLSVSKQFATAQSQIAQMNHVLKQQLFEIERQWNGSTKERFYADFIAAQRVMDNFSSLSLSIAKTLEGHAEKFRLADQQTVQSHDANCMPPPPDECRAPAVDNRNAFQKSVDSLKELGTGFMQAADDRYQKRYDSVGGFLDYWTFGIPSGLVEGYMDRADKAFNSANDTANWLTFGIHGTIREAIFPTNAWSSEHWANMMGMGGMMVGGGLTAKMIKPHNLLTSSGGGTKVSAFNHSPEAGRMTDNSKITRTGAEWDEYLRSKYGDDNVTWVNKNNFEYLDGFDDHLINAQSIVRKKNKGIVGGHNLESFERILIDQGWNLEELIVSKTPHPTISGVLEIDYRIPALDRELKVIADQYKNIPSPKTVYDPKVISNDQMIQWGKEAMASGEIVVREIRGTASNGLKFTGYLDENGRVTNFFPTISE
ncbi:WXG100 family type VII secretion target [Paenibacillus xylanexedens]|uniref:WXG100 family type VII secretion target n=1 Tax=Paenibacillus xylanexedens TaxID=528191 RepID=UPI0011A5E87E|nr:WXG100 family type VII secretion target [Paenibacillus xylanexedens]